MSKRIFALCVAVMMTFVGSFAVNATTNNNTVQPKLDYTSSVAVNISISNNVAECTTQVIGYNSATKIKITMTLQRRGVLFWNEVDTWTTTYYDNVAMMSKTCGVNSGKYRVKAELVVYSGSNSENITNYSRECEY